MNDKLDERRELLESKGRIREFVFGIQDGTMSTVGLLAGMEGATNHRALVVLAGITAVLSGSISMAAGSYLSARAEKDILGHEKDEAAKLADAEPYLAQQGVMDALVREGLAKEQAYRIVRMLSTEHRVLMTTFNEKVFGLGGAEINQPLKGAAVMALSFILGGALPLVPYVLLNGRVALGVSSLAAALALFGVGAFKGQLSGQSRSRSGALFFAIAVGSAILGYGIGLVADAIVPGAGAAAAAGGL